VSTVVTFTVTSSALRANIASVLEEEKAHREANVSKSVNMQAGIQQLAIIYDR